MLSVVLEDRYPPALAPGTSRTDLTFDGFYVDAKGPALQKGVEGSIVVAVSEPGGTMAMGYPRASIHDRAGGRRGTPHRHSNM